MKAFLLAMIAIVGISFLASIGLETFELSTEQANATNSVRLD